jgi:hypothetical protein
MFVENTKKPNSTFTDQEIVEFSSLIFAPFFIIWITPFTTLDNVNDRIIIHLAIFLNVSSFIPLYCVLMEETRHLYLAHGYS